MIVSLETFRPESAAERRANICQPKTEVSPGWPGWYRQPPGGVLHASADDEVDGLLGGGLSFSSCESPYASHRAIVAIAWLYICVWPEPPENRSPSGFWWETSQSRPFWTAFWYFEGSVWMCPAPSSGIRARPVAAVSDGYLFEGLGGQRALWHWGEWSRFQLPSARWWRMTQSRPVCTAFSERTDPPSA